MLLDALMKGHSYNEWKTSMELTDNQESCIIKQFTGEFFLRSPQLLEPRTLELSSSLKQSMKSSQFKEAVLDLINFGISRYKDNYSTCEIDSSLCINKKYTYSEICQFLNYDKDLASVMNGYWFDAKTNSFSVFINYDKDGDTPEGINYHDRFGSFSNTDDMNHFIAISKRDRTTKSRDISNISNYKRAGTTIRLFVRKNKNDITSKEFYYLGQVEHTGKMKEGVLNGTQIPIVEIEYKFIKPIDNRIYEYLSEKTI